VRDVADLKVGSYVLLAAPSTPPEFRRHERQDALEAVGVVRDAHGLEPAVRLAE